MSSTINGLGANYNASGNYSYEQVGSALDTEMLDYLQQNNINLNSTGETSSLEFEDFMLLMVKQLQSQTLDSTMDTSEMLNQLVQMSSVQMMGSLQDSMLAMAQSTNLTYAASLVGKEVTVGQVDSTGAYSQVVGTVTATGTYQGTAVLFVGDDMYALNEILAVGRLPDLTQTPDADTDTDDSTDSVDPTEGTEQTQP